MNYFELFNIPFQFALVPSALAQSYHQLQRVVHPDKFAHASEHQQLLAVQKSAQVNDAFQTLKSPLSRALYMLAEQGVDLQIEQKTLQDPAFLIQQMEYREQLEAIGDQIAQHGDPQAEIQDFEQQIKQQTAQLYDELEPLLVSSCKISLANAATLVRKLKFMNKLAEELDRLEGSLQ